MSSIKLSAIAVTMSLLGSLSASVEASDDIHNKAIAKAKYEEFKAGGGADPLELIRKEYGKKHLEDVGEKAASQKRAMLFEKISEEQDRISTFKNSHSSYKSQKKRAIYESSMRDDGFDASAYSDGYANYLETNRGRVSETLGDRQNFSDDILQGSKEIMSSYGQQHTYNAEVAANNIIDVIRADKVSYASSVKETMEAQIAQAKDRVPVGEQAYTLAHEFNGECGDACDIVSIIPDLEPEDDCRFDISNFYIMHSESSHSEFGTWEESDRSIKYVWDGKTVYSYQIRSRSSGERGDNPEVSEYEEGTTSGYKKGTWSEEDSSSGYDLYGDHKEDFYEICKS